MISSEVEDRIARYFFHRYLPEDVRLEIVGKLLPFYLIDNPLFATGQRVQGVQKHSVGL